jgi:AraC family transcriptional regulator of adaptative response / DNA-3-methyladenine glycosylase II
MSHSGSDLIQTTHRIPYDEPYDYQCVLDYLAIRAVSGVEYVSRDTYRRTYQLDGKPGILEVSDDPHSHCLQVNVWTANPENLPAVLERVARLFGVDLAPAEALACLQSDPLLGPLVEARPGLRIPGAWDAFEIAVRAVTGQQVTLRAATAMVSRAARICGTDLKWPAAEAAGLNRLFPEPAQLAAANLYDVGMPSQRMAALRSLASLAANDTTLFSPDPAGRKRLLSQPGVGDWTAQYIAMRAHRNQDAFPAADVVIRRMLGEENGARMTPSSALRRAEAWRPWRTWATLHLWTASATGRKTPPLKARAAGA